MLILRDIRIARITLDVVIELADASGNFLVTNRNIGIACGIGKIRGGFTNCPDIAEATADSRNKRQRGEHDCEEKEQFTAAAFGETRKGAKLAALVLSKLDIRASLTVKLQQSFC